MENLSGIISKEKGGNKMYVVIREMRPHLDGFDVPKNKLKDFIKKNKGKGIEIFVYENGKLVKKISRG